MKDRATSRGEKEEKRPDRSTTMMFTVNLSGRVNRSFIVSRRGVKAVDTGPRTRVHDTYVRWHTRPRVARDEKEGEREREGKSPVLRVQANGTL